MFVFMLLALLSSLPPPSAPAVALRVRRSFRFPSFAPRRASAAEPSFLGHFWNEDAAAPDAWNEDADVGADLGPDHGRGVDPLPMHPSLQPVPGERQDRPRSTPPTWQRGTEEHALLEQVARGLEEGRFKE